MSRTRRKQDSDITRIVGILFLEVLATILLLNLVSFANEQRTELDEPEFANRPPAALASNSYQSQPSPYPYPEPAFSRAETLGFDGGKSVPKVAVGRYNGRW
ncbi:hypothetical protein [Mariniblastus fucicola]|uniref:Uncharacterized protein n=1 Tax=Mariniblastus fucicola TaxID=980251 RepID=A0A5B9PEA0_9BACT|nr:hypothetical protein [Mariniblastus fucicola]QEG24738.1 hypothetical protein MFFC18_46600 [Mariniblastus fucicola]